MKNEHEAAARNPVLVRVTGVLALLFAAFHIVVGVLGIVELGALRDGVQHMLDSARDQGIKGFEGSSPEEVIAIYRVKTIFALALGTAAATCAIGLLLLRRWATKAWFVVALAATLFYAWPFVSAASRSTLTIPETIPVIVAALLLCLGWFAMQKPRSV